MEEDNDDEKTSALVNLEGSFEEVCTEVLYLLKTREPNEVENVSAELHRLPPFVSRQEWTFLSDKIKLAEEPTIPKIPGEKWISLRCDGTGFSKLKKRFQNDRVFGQGISPNDFASIMQVCCKDLMIKFSGVCGYTQSDEMTILLAPTCVIRGERENHRYNGRVQKLCSVAAATVTARFNYELMTLCSKRGDVDLLEAMKCMPTFDCRVGAYDTKDQAVSLILWRAYDCSVNGVSDAVYKSGIPGSMEVMMKITEDKLAWLLEQGLLPLTNHQRDGSFFIKRKRIEQVEGNVLQRYKDGTLFPTDEVLR